MEILKLGSYTAAVNHLEHRYDKLTSLINDFDRIIPRLEQACNTNETNAYVVELKSIREDLRSKRDRIYNYLIPELKSEIEKEENNIRSIYD